MSAITFPFRSRSALGLSFILGSKSRKIAQRGALDELRFGLWPTSRGQLRGPSEVMCQLTTSCESTRNSRVPCL